MRVELEVDGVGREVEVEAPDSLLSALRDGLGVLGPKDGCGEGECGACTVLLDGVAVNACLVPAAQADGAAVTTVVGLGDDDRSSRLQRALAEAGAVQCGYCTPGIVVAAGELLDREPEPSRERIASALAGNLCRCTGYAKIVDAVESASGGGEEGA